MENDFLWGGVFGIVCIWVMWLVDNLTKKDIIHWDYSDGRKYIFIKKTNQLLPANMKASTFEIERAGTPGALYANKEER